MYIQGTGSRKIRFIPPAGCVVKCSTHTVTTQASDVCECHSVLNPVGIHVTFVCLFSPFLILSIEVSISSVKTVYLFAPTNTD